MLIKCITLKSKWQIFPQLFSNSLSQLHSVIFNSAAWPGRDRAASAHHLLEHGPHGEVDDEIAGAIDDKEEVVHADKNRYPDWSLTAATIVQEWNFRIENVLW